MSQKLFRRDRPDISLNQDLVNICLHNGIKWIFAVSFLFGDGQITRNKCHGKYN